MSHDDLQSIGKYLMPSFPARASDLGFLFGTRHGARHRRSPAAAPPLWRERPKNPCNNVAETILFGIFVTGGPNILRVVEYM
jgi:hypothetical protein